MNSFGRFPTSCNECVGFSAEQKQPNQSHVVCDKACRSGPHPIVRNLFIHLSASSSFAFVSSASCLRMNCDETMISQFYTVWSFSKIYIKSFLRNFGPKFQHQPSLTLTCEYLYGLCIACESVCGHDVPLCSLPVRKPNGNSSKLSKASRVSLAAISPY